MTDEGSTINGSVAGMKRPAQDDSNYFASSEKRPLVMDKVAAAAEAAARINQKLGGSQVSINNNSLSNNNTNGINVITTETAIPDRYVGLVIGKKGEQITQLQNDTNCKVQISQVGGNPERTVTLTGTPDQIGHAKQMINDIIDRADKNGPVPQPTYQAGAGTVTMIELMIPGMKAGLIIGKSGETIKNLQEEHGVKMVLIQQNNNPTPDDKPLRISGDPSRVEKARQAIMALLNTRERPGGHAFSYEGREFVQYAVPAEKAGLVIGKGGETIKEICNTCNAHVEISKEPSPDPAIKIFNVRGTAQTIEHALKLISERTGIAMTRPVTTSTAATGTWGQYGFTADPWSMGAGAAQGALGAGMPTPTYNPYTGQLDYSAAWVKYYRDQGMHDYADATLRLAQQPQAQGGSTVPAHIPAAQPNPIAPAVPVQNQASAAGQYDYNQWQQWQQWQMWQHAWQQTGAPGQPNAAAPGQPMPAPGHPSMPQQ